MEVLRKQDIIFINIVDAEILGEKMYPTIAQKTSLRVYNIIANHVFLIS